MEKVYYASVTPGINICFCQSWFEQPLCDPNHHAHIELTQQAANLACRNRLRTGFVRGMLMDEVLSGRFPTDGRRNSYRTNDPSNFRGLRGNGGDGSNDDLTGRKGGTSSDRDNSENHISAPTKFAKLLHCFTFLQQERWNR